MVAYIVGTLGIFRLVSARAPKLVAYFAAAIYALNPNLLYMQITAMNEPIFLAFFIWTVVYLDEFLRASSPPTAASICAGLLAVKARARPGSLWDDFGGRGVYAIRRMVCRGHHDGVILLSSRAGGGAGERTRGGVR